MIVDAFQIAQRFVGVKETPGIASNPLITAMLKLDNDWPQGEDVPWCAAFVNFIAWLLRLPRSRKLSARSWLQVGFAIQLQDAIPQYDVVILKRGKEPQPGPEVIVAQGHVGFFAGLSLDKQNVFVLGGNQNDQVNVSQYPISQILGIRRLA